MFSEKEKKKFANHLSGFLDIDLFYAKIQKKRYYFFWPERG